MVVPYDGKHGNEGTHIAADSLTAFRMALHDRPFVLRQRSAFEQDVVGNSHFADVMQITRPLQGQDVARRQAHGNAHRRAHLGDSLAVLS